MDRLRSPSLGVPPMLGELWPFVKPTVSGTGVGQSNLLGWLGELGEDAGLAFFAQAVALAADANGG
jgi:hypothetical protein